VRKYVFFQKSQGMMGNNHFGGQADSELGQRHSAKFRPAGGLEVKMDENGLWVYYPSGSFIGKFHLIHPQHKAILTSWEFLYLG